MGEKEIEDIVDEMKERDREERETGMKVKKQKKELEMCPQYMDAPAVGYLTIKLQNSTGYKCLNLSLTGLRTYVYTFVQKDVHS